MADMIDIEVLNVRLPKEIVSWLDILVQKGVYKSRSEAIRDFLRNRLASSVEKEVSND